MPASAASPSASRARARAAASSASPPAPSGAAAAAPSTLSAKAAPAVDRGWSIRVGIHRPSKRGRRPLPEVGTKAGVAAGGKGVERIERLHLHRDRRRAGGGRSGAVPITSLTITGACAGAAAGEFAAGAGGRAVVTGRSGATVATAGSLGGG